MSKRGKRKFIFSSCIFEIVLLISMSFAFSFLLSENLVKAQSLSVAGGAGKDLARGFIGNDNKWILGDGNYFLDPSTGTIYRDGAFQGYLGKDSTVTQSLHGGTTEGAGQAAERSVGTVVGDIFKGKAFGDPLVTGQVGPGLGTLNVLTGALAWAGLVAGLVYVIGSFLGVDKGTLNALTYAAAAGSFTTAGIALGYKNAVGTSLEFWGGAGALGAGVLIAFAVLALTYSKEKKKLVSFQCLPFEPPIGGAKCEECNKDPFRPCSEYRCRALGQACQILNPGTAEERCTWVNPKDVKSPTIEPWLQALKPTGLRYIPDNAIRPPNRGVKVVRGGASGCLQAFTPLEFGVILNEPAQCKIDYNHTAKFDDMQFFVGGSNYHRYNHTQKMKLPGPDINGSDDAIVPELKNNGFFSLFVRCRDANKNENVDEFVFNFCVDPSHDTTPPIIEGTSISNGGFVQYNADKVPIEVYTNEPAECKWSRESKDYKDMENMMKCFTDTYQINADLNYVCTGNLTGIKNQEDNTFYFRCKDQPGKAESERNVNTQSTPLILKGSQPLNILEVSPNATIFGSTDTVPVDLKVKTDDGAEEGKSICYFSTTGQRDSYIAMFETNSFEHRQQLDLTSGNYQFYFRCIDLGGNSADGNNSFSVFVDKQAPRVTRAYKDEGLKIVTDEDAECVYSLNSCNYEFKDGLPMIYSNPSMKKNHFAEWKSSVTYYVKCQDLYGNTPSPNDCSIVAGAIELAKKA